MLDVRSPFPEYAWPMAWTWMQRIWERVADDFIPRERNAWVESRIARSQAEGVRTWGVYRDAELGGLIWFEPVNPVTGSSQVLFKKSFWGRATTVPAMQSAYRDVFDSGIRKITISVFADNHAIRSLARSIGVREEGILRGHTMRGGKLADVVVLSLTREDYEHAFSTGGDGAHIGHQRGRADRRGSAGEAEAGAAAAVFQPGAGRPQHPAGGHPPASDGEPGPGPV